MRDTLRARFLDPYDHNGTITWDGRQLTVANIDQVRITAGTKSVPVMPPNQHEQLFTFLLGEGDDVTNDFILGPPGAAGSSEPATAGATPSPSTAAAGARPPDPRRVMVVYRRNEGARVAIFTFLRVLGLEPIEREAAVAETGKGAPHNLEAVRAAMDAAQAVAVVLTAEDHAGLLPPLAGANDAPDLLLQDQPRQNVILEAGLAMGLSPDRTILVELGRIRRASDFDGLHCDAGIDTHPGACASSTRGALPTPGRSCASPASLRS